MIEMDEKTYRMTVIKMRAHADAWFRQHKQSDLIEARKLERVIDAENKRWLDEIADQRPTVDASTASGQAPLSAQHETQGNLFEHENGDGKTS